MSSEHCSLDINNLNEVKNTLIIVNNILANLEVNKFINTKNPNEFADLAKVIKEVDEISRVSTNILWKFCNIVS